MAVFTPSGPSVRGASLTKVTPSIQTLSLPLAATEYSIALTPGCVEFKIKARGSAQLRVGFSAGSTISNDYITVPPGAVYSEGSLANLGLTLYVWSARPGEVVELLCWTS
jgi:hypothetical protein